MQIRYDTAVFERFTLSNGIPVYIQRPPILTDERCKITAFLPTVGGCADPPEAPGTAHFREHLALRGTTNYPTRHDVARPFHALGGRLRGDTDIASTRYTMITAADQLVATLPILGEIIMCPRFDDDNINIERRRITDEFFLCGGDSEHFFHRHWLPAFFGDHPYGHSPIGTLPSVQTMSANTLRQFQEGYYHAGNLAIVAAGDLPADQTLLELLEQTYGLMTSRPTFQVHPSIFTEASTTEVTDPAFGYDSLTITYPMLRPGHRTRHAWRALAGYLAYDISSAEESGSVTEAQQSIYSKISCRFNLSLHYAALQLVARTQRQNFPVVEEAIRMVLERLAENQFQTFQQRAQRHRRLEFMHPLEADELVIDALAIREEPHTIRQSEAIFDTIEWSDLDACRQQLLETRPFIFKALAG